MNRKLYSISSLVAGALAITMMVIFSQPAAATHSALAILSMPSESIGSTRTLARVYSEPDVASQVVNVLSPEKQVRILGLNEDGAWLGIGKENGAAVLAGWIPVSDVRHNLVVGSSRSLVHTYQLPDSSGSVAGTLAPSVQVQVLGRSVDNAWIAIAHPGARSGMLRWVKANELKLPDVVAQTSALTKLYLKPDSSSRVTSVLPPAQSVILIGQNGDGSWFAVTSRQGNKFIGWAQSNDLTGGMDRVALPVYLPR